jgi:tape measure domain-containing protein
VANGLQTSIRLNDEMSSRLEHIANQMNRVLRSANMVNIATQNMIPISVTSNINRATIAIDRAGFEAEQSARQQEQYNRSMLNASGGASKLVGVLKGVIGAYAGIQGIRVGMNAIDNYINQTSRLNMINDGLQTQKDLQDMIYNSAERSRASYGDTLNTVAKLGLLAKDAFSSNQETVRFAELMNKSFKVGGASIQEQTNGMYQLTQALASGKLQGDEFRSITENAPMIAQAIAKYTGKSMGSLKELSSQGAITAEIIKGAMFASADDIENKFKTIPKTFGDIFTSMKNRATRAFAQVMKRVNDLINTERFEQFINNITQGFIAIANMAMNLLDVIVPVINFMADNWGLISLGIGAVIGAFAGLKIAIDLAKLAQLGLNFALLKSPLLWIVALIGIVVAALIYWRNELGSWSAVYLKWCDIVLYNFDKVALYFRSNINDILTTYDKLDMGVSKISVSIIDAFGDMKVKVIKSFQDMVNDALGNLNWFISQLNKIPSVNIEPLKLATFGDNAVVNNQIEKNLRAEGLRAMKTANIQKEYDRSQEILWRTQLMESDHAGRLETIKLWKQDAKMNDPLANAFDLSNIEKLLAGISDNTGNMSESLEINGEDLQLMRDIAERNAIINLTTQQPNISITTGPISSVESAQYLIDNLATILDDGDRNSIDGVYAM